MDNQAGRQAGMVGKRSQISVMTNQSLPLPPSSIPLSLSLSLSSHLSEQAAAAAAAAAVYSTTTDDAEEAPEADGIHDRVVEWWVDWLFRRFI